MNTLRIFVKLSECYSANIESFFFCHWLDVQHIAVVIAYITFRFITTTAAVLAGRLHLKYHIYNEFCSMHIGQENYEGIPEMAVLPYARACAFILWDTRNFADSQKLFFLFQLRLRKSVEPCFTMCWRLYGAFVELFWLSLMSIKEKRKCTYTIVVEFYNSENTETTF